MVQSSRRFKFCPLFGMPRFAVSRGYPRMDRPEYRTKGGEATAQTVDQTFVTAVVSLTGRSCSSRDSGTRCSRRISLLNTLEGDYTWQGLAFSMIRITLSSFDTRFFSRRA